MDALVPFGCMFNFVNDIYKLQLCGNYVINHLPFLFFFFAECEESKEATAKVHLPLFLAVVGEIENPVLSIWSVNYYVVFF